MTHLGICREHGFAVRAVGPGVRRGCSVGNDVRGGFQNTTAGVADCCTGFQRALTKPAHESFDKEAHVAMLTRTAL